MVKGISEQGKLGFKIKWKLLSEFAAVHYLSDIFLKESVLATNTSNQYFRALFLWITQSP